MSNKKTDTSVMTSIVETLLLGNMLRYQVGSQMWCPACHQCLDWQDAVGIDFINPDASVVYTKCYCGTCYDTRISANINATRLELEHKVQRPVSIKITDGRQYLDDSGAILDAVIQEDLVPCKTRHKDVGWVDVMGFRVSFGDTPWAGQCFVYQSKSGQWHVIEPRTGSALATSGSRQAAVLRAGQSLLRVGEEKFLKGLSKMFIANQRLDRKFAQQAARLAAA
jgi:hypothetical protein